MEITKEEFIKLLKDYTFVDSFIKKAVDNPALEVFTFEEVFDLLNFYIKEKKK